MNKIAIVFPGQASQYVGMGKDLFENYSEVRELYQFASDEIGEDMARLSFEGPAERLKETRFTQPAILLHSLALLKIMKDTLPTAELTAGHSLGEYGSLALSGVLSFEDSLRAVIKRAFLMEEACLKNPGTMAAVIGLDEQKIEGICRTASARGIVVPANFNSGNQIVISGTVSGVEEACNLCKEAGAKRAMILQVGGAFHSPLMASAVPGLAAFLQNVKFNTPGIAIVPNVTASTETNPDNLKKLLLEQITSPVRWQQTMQFLGNYGIDAMIEVGPGKVLSGLAKREMANSKIINIDKLEDIDTFVEAKAN